MTTKEGEAWQRMLEALPQDTTPMNSWGDDLHLVQWPGFQKVWAQPDDGWVFHYEQARAALARQERRQGRLQTGVFYTPPSIARYLIQRSLGRFLEAKLASIRAQGEAHRNVLVASALQEVQPIRLIDPACGTGIFLVEGLRSLASFYTNLAALLPDGGPEQGAVWVLNAMTEQIYGIDMDELALAIAEARTLQWGLHFLAREYPSFPLETILPHWKESRFLSHWACQDALGDTPSVFEANMWHFIVGNPPYISQVRGHGQRFQALGKTETRYHHPKMDLCDAFLAWAVYHLEPDGQFAFVLPEYWSQRTAAAPIRERLWAEGSIQELRIFPDTPLFPEAPGHHSAFLVWERRHLNASDKSLVLDSTAIRQGYFSSKGDATNLQAEDLQTAGFYRHPRNGKLFYGEPDVIALLARLSGYASLLKAEEISQGLVMPQGRIRRDGRKVKGRKGVQDGESGSLAEEEGVFLLTEEDVLQLHLNADEMALLKPYYAPQGFSAFTGWKGTESATSPSPHYQLIYGDTDARAKFQADPRRYARLIAHLERFKEWNTSSFAPYGLHRARKTHWFEGENRILSLRQTMRPCFALLEIPAYVNEAFCVIHPAENPAYITALLNSDLAHFWFYHQKRKGHQLQVDKDVLLSFPAPPSISTEQIDQLANITTHLSQQSDGSASFIAKQTRKTTELNILVSALYYRRNFRYC